MILKQFKICSTSITINIAKIWNFVIITYQSSPNVHHQAQKSQQMLVCMWENGIRYTLLMVVYIIVQIMLIILVVTQNSRNRVARWPSSTTHRYDPTNCISNDKRSLRYILIDAIIIATHKLKQANCPSRD